MVLPHPETWHTGPPGITRFGPRKSATGTKKGMGRTHFHPGRQRLCVCQPALRLGLRHTRERISDTSRLLIPRQIACPGYDRDVATGQCRRRFECAGVRNRTLFPQDKLHRHLNAWQPFDKCPRLNVGKQGGHSLAVSCKTQSEVDRQRRRLTGIRKVPRPTQCQILRAILVRGGWPGQSFVHRGRPFLIFG